MRMIETKIIITCDPEELEDDSVYCDGIGNCNICYQKSFGKLEKSSEGKQNFKIEKFTIGAIIDFKKRMR